MFPKDECWDGWQCHLISGCLGGVEYVTCTGNYGHGAPYRTDGNHISLCPEKIVEGTRIQWEFMKAHPKTTKKA